MSIYRSSTSDLSRFDEGPRRGGGGERWDRERFERMRGGDGGGGRGGGGGGRDDYDHFRFTEHDRFPGGRRDIDIHEDYDRRGPPARVAERERFREDERFDRPARRRTDLFEEPTPSEIANKALAPYRRKSVVEKDLDIQIRRPTRPQYIRRQSSLDTFDRRPPPRFSEYEREEWRPPANVPIPLPIREQRRRSPERRFRDDYDEDIRYRESERERDRGRDFDEYREIDIRKEREREREPRGRDFEEFREVEVKREKSKRRRSRSRAARSIAATSVRSSSTSSFEDVSVDRKVEKGRKGKTRMPKRLVKRQAVIDLGYPYEEEVSHVTSFSRISIDHT